MGLKTAQKSHNRPLISRFGGSHMVDLAIGADEAVKGMREDYSYTDEAGDKVTRYSPDRDADHGFGLRTSARQPYGLMGSREVVVTESPDVDDGYDAYANNDVQPEPSEADGEDQNMGGRRRPYPSDMPRTPRRRAGGIG